MKIDESSNNQQQSSKLAKAILQLINSLLTKQNQVCIAVSGGKSPIKLFQALSKQDIKWENVTITLVDERFIPINHEDSNEKLVRDNLLINKAAVANFSGLVTNENSILDSVNNANLHTRNIDIAILGMGEDGHTASIFPCCDELKTVIDTSITPEKYVITTPKTAKYQRIGLSLNGILEIPNLFVSINGHKKLEIIKEAAKEINSKYPISYVLTKRKDAQIFWHA